MLEGVNGPPIIPEEINPSAGVTVRPVGVLELTVKLMGLVVFPLPLVVFVKVTVSLYGVGLAARPFALLLTDTVTVVLAPASSVPLAEERLTHAWVIDAVQLTELLPVF